MDTRYAIGPSIGVARLGDSPNSFYLAPDGIGALPIECDEQGEIALMNGQPAAVRRFKDADARVRRQGALFRVYRIGDKYPHGDELMLGHSEVKSIRWTAHLANKKAAWYNFAELEGNLLYGEKNSYVARMVPHRNAHVRGTNRRELVIDPGPRTLCGASQHIAFDRASAGNYAHVSFPQKPSFGQQVTTLGDMRTDSAGRLIILGGFGRSGGDSPISSFAGADSWYDDVADGPITCVIELKSGEVHTARAWCIVGSPKFAPELVNIVSLDDTLWDVAVRHLNAAPDLFSHGKFCDAFIANYERDIAPILERPGSYRWVANAPAMNSLSPPPFDARDKGAGLASIRQAYLQHFRKPSSEGTIDSDANTLFMPGSGFPWLPINSGNNSVANDMPDKFLTLTETQYFVLSQWAKGKFVVAPMPEEDIPRVLSRAAVGNCVGGPFCPGIEVTWSTRNPRIYSDPFCIRHRHPEQWYVEHGLDTEEDETDVPALGCEPGDLTKRMAIPWQADFFQCSIQYVDFSDPAVNQSQQIPAPPTYYTYWWPPQSPWVVITGDLDPASQQAAGTPAGLQVLYTRGINTFAQMISSWSYMGFVLNVASDPHRDLFPYFVEQERNHEAFIAAAVAIGDAGNVSSGADSNFSNAWFLPAPTATTATRPTVTFSTSRRQGRVAFRD